jgi:cytochrome c oxidase cbb3-type subunit I
LISLHFWLVVGGFAIYFIGLSIGGWLQGLAMLNAKQPFMASVAVTLPYLQARSLGGALMTLGHLVFGTHFFLMMFSLKQREAGATRFGFLRMSRNDVSQVPL